MVETILNLVLAGAQIFTEERRRYYEDKLADLLAEQEAAKTARYPHYSDSRIYRAQKALDDFVVAYAAELGQAAQELKQKAGVV